MRVGPIVQCCVRSNRTRKFALVQGIIAMLTSNQASEEAGAPEKQPKVAWRKAELPELTTASTTAEVALTEIILGCVEHLRGNEVCVLSREHEEGIHQMRVATRRLRSCLALYGKFIPSEQLDYITGELKWLIGELGPARDWDVFVADGFAPVAKQLEDEGRLTELGEQIEHLRNEAYVRAQAAIGSQRYVGLVLLLNSWAEGRGWRDPGRRRASSRADAGKGVRHRARTAS